MIGVTAGIEADAVSPHWLQPSHETVDKIIVPSEFAKQGFLNAIEKYSFMFDENTKENLHVLESRLDDKISVVHYPVKDYNLVDLEIDFETDFNFLLVAQWSPRKNIKETIETFLTEFGEDENVGLVVKTSVARNCVPDRALVEERFQTIKSKFPDAKCKIYLLHGSMTEDEIHSLYHHPKIKAMINFGHGEGFGLPLFEAAYCGLPVITHDFGGQKDFLYAPKKSKKGESKLRPHFSKVLYSTKPIEKEAVWEKVIEKDAEWAYPNFNSCKMAMRQAVKSYGVVKGEAKRLRAWILENFSEKKAYVSLHRVAGLEELKDAEYVFVSDFFTDEVNGGAELSLEALIRKCPESYVKIKSDKINDSIIEFYKDKKWIFGNMANLNKSLIDLMIEEKIDYSVIEFDFKFCEYRLLELHETLEGEKCDCATRDHGKAIKKFFEGANYVFFMSDKQRDIHIKHINLDKEKCVRLSSVFDDEFFEKLKQLRKKYKDDKSDKWVISSSPSWVKGSIAAKRWCKENDIEFARLHNKSYEESLELLASSKGLCFLPQGSDTCPRMVIEAKLLGCELELNDSVLNLQEEWFDTNNLEEIEDYLRKTPDRFWDCVNGG